MREKTYFALPSEKKNQLRKIEILKLLKKGNCSANDLLSALDKNGLETTLPSLKKDIISLKNDGYTIYSRKGLYHLELTEEEADLGTDGILNNSERGLSLLQFQYESLLLISEEPMSFSGIAENINESAYSIRRNVINVLKDNSLIYYDEDHKKYEYSYPLHLYHLPPKDHLLKLLSERLNLPKSIYELSINHLSSEFFAQKENARSELYNLPKYIKYLNKYNYKQTPLSFSYKSEKGKEKLVNFFLVGIIAYSVEKDEIYLIGRTRPSKNNPTFELIKPSSIDWNTLTVSSNIINFNRCIEKDQIYLNTIRKDFSEIKNEMFLISAEKPRKIKVEIEHSPKTEKEFFALQEKRSNTASVYISDDGYIVYEDTIRGTGDFAKFLRKYGSSIRVIQDEQLQKRMKETAERAVSNYEKYI